MSKLCVAFGCGLVTLSLIAVSATAQTSPDEVPRTAWGAPDLGGVWDYKTRTPLERPERFGDREFLTAEEAAEIPDNERASQQAMEERPAQRTVAIPPAGDRPGRWLDSPDHPSLQGQTGSYNIFWFDWGTGPVSTLRTSLIVDPPNGRMPELTLAGRERARTMGARSSFSETVVGAESHLDFSNSDRCLMSGNAGPPMLPGVYNNNMQLFQTPDHVAIMNEMMHTVRIIPIDAPPAPDDGVRQYVGEGRGHWEGDTLVVETKDFNDDRTHITWRNTSRNRTLVERFTRVDVDTMLYEFTVIDTYTWGAPWSGQLPMQHSALPVFEFACHEGNYGLLNMLAGNRKQEAEAGR